jgi:hypothetical protein
MAENSVPRWVEKMRAAGYQVMPATRETLPDPEHVLPRRIGWLRHRFTYIQRWFR